MGSPVNNGAVAPSNGIQISTRSIEAAMVAQILKDSMDPSVEVKIVKALVWEKDDGLKENLTIRVHPSFPNESVAFRRVNERIESWITGGKPPVDKNAIFRLVGKAGVYWDISMESFEKAVLSDDGLLAIGLGRANGMVKEPMNLMGSMRLRLYKPDGLSVSRKECLDLIRRSMQSKKKEKMQSAREIAKQEDEIIREQKVLNQSKTRSDRSDREDVQVNENGPVKALVQQLKERDDKKWVQESQLLSEKSNGIQSEKNEFLEPLETGGHEAPSARQKNEPQEDKAKTAPGVLLASAAQFKVMGAPLKNQPSKEHEIKQNKIEAVEIEKENLHEEAEEQAFDEIEVDWDIMSVGSDEASLNPPSKEKELELESATQNGLAKNQESFDPRMTPSKEEVSKSQSVQVEIREGSRDAGNEKSISQEPGASKNKIQMNWVREIFPALPEGWDEIMIAVQVDRWNDLMEVLQPLESFELRVISKEVGIWSVGLAIPSECFKQTTPLFVQFATGGVMFKRAKKFTNE